jgi:paraquat-inducible protein A
MAIEEASPEGIIACETCGLVQLVEAIPPGAAARCARCGFTVHHRKKNSLARTAAFALAALVLYWPANLFPIVSVDYMGSHIDTTIYNGVKSLFKEGQWFTGALVFTTSIFTPLLKILGLLVLALIARSPRWPKLLSWTFRTIEFIDPWNMLEVYLLSIMVSIMEMGRLATVVPGPAVVSFALTVFLMVLASHSFDSRLVWDRMEARR